MICFVIYVLWVFQSANVINYLVVIYSEVNKNAHCGGLNSGLRTNESRLVRRHEQIFFSSPWLPEWPLTSYLMGKGVTFPSFLQLGASHLLTARCVTRYSKNVQTRVLRDTRGFWTQVKLLTTPCSRKV